MRISPKKYAQSFFPLAVKADSQAEIDRLVKNFVQLLRENMDLKKQAEILRELELLFNQAENKVKVKVASAKKLGAEDIKHLTLALKKFGQYKTVEIENEVDEKLIGGLRLQLGWQVTDATLKNQLNKLKESLV